MSKFWYLVYEVLAAPLPSQLRWAKKFRRFTARRFCKFISSSANINSKVRLSRETVVLSHGGIGEGTRIMGPVTIGEHVTMGPDCRFITGSHPTPPDGGKFRQMAAFSLPITVEDDVFIGASVLVLPGVTIGKGAVIGAGSVVTKDVRAGATVVGNPAREIRLRKV